MAFVTPADCPKSVRNRCVFEVFGGVFVLSRCFLDFSVRVGAFVIGPSQISFFSSFSAVDDQALSLTPYMSSWKSSKERDLPLLR